MVKSMLCQCCGFIGDWRFRDVTLWPNVLLLELDLADGSVLATFLLARRCDYRYYGVHAIAEAA